MGKDDILAKGAILQRDQETYAITARLLAGVMDIPTAHRIADVAEKYGVKRLKITGDSRMALIGIKEEDLDAAYEDLGIKPQPGTALCQQFIKACPGNTFCTRGQQDTLSLAQKVEEQFYPFPKISSKVKIGISGCYNSCSEPAIKDIGLIGLPKGWILMVGGAGGKDPMIAQVIAKNLSEDEVLEVLEKILKYYRASSQKHQTRNMRLGVILSKEGNERLLRACGLE
ncbi:MAG: NAD(P)/FAD-dependent oxidoreductase [Deltaproteobacteria bacterium]|uniref:NAD(P)/FAD-dependent oxidoreductase n=1 Tax=Candidatus Desulfacyla euxinica TaxID=2841693 RepID=A0A8J6N0K7_9DELT|nr:NAD(P)/FAD-dependent oxidoreductase [Candidatus Desulfacyla euxinica]